MLPARLDPRRDWLAYLGAAGVALAVLLTLLAPEASRGLAPIPRLAFWLVHTLTPIALSQIATLAVLRIVPATGAARWGAIAAGGAIGAVAFAPIAAGIDALRDGGGLTLSDITDEAGGLLLPVLVAWTVLNAARILRLTDPAPTAPPDPAAPPILGRLRPDLRGEIVALSAELHYLRVHTTRGADLVLYPLGQAMAEMPPGAGMQVHRSHWAAFAHMDRLDKAGSAGRLHLTGGLSVPVARTRLSDLRRHLTA